MRASSIVLLRTSALGDVTHVVPLLRSLQSALPQARITWIIGALERKLVGDIEGVKFICFDKARGLAGWHAVRRELHGRHFDALLHMQVSMRANLLSLALSAQRRIGYDRARTKELHGLFINERIAAQHGQHVLDALGSFAAPLGVQRNKVRWDIPIPGQDLEWAQAQWPADCPTLVISPCSSHAARNWRAERYAAVADHAIKALGLQVVLSGGRSVDERRMGEAILARMRGQPINLIGKDTLKGALAMYARAQLVLSPDSGPMHMANAMGTPVLGLHAATNPERSGPYSDRQWCVNRYDDAARKFLHKPAADLRWGTRIQRPGVMDLISVDDVIERLEAFTRTSVTSSISTSDAAQ